MYCTFDLSPRSAGLPKVAVIVASNSAGHSSWVSLPRSMWRLSSSQAGSASRSGGAFTNRVKSRSHGACASQTTRDCGFPEGRILGQPLLPHSAAAVGEFAIRRRCTMPSMMPSQAVWEVLPPSPNLGFSPVRDACLPHCVGVSESRQSARSPERRGKSRERLQ